MKMGEERSKEDRSRDGKRRGNNGSKKETYRDRKKREDGWKRDLGR